MHSEQQKHYKAPLKLSLNERERDDCLGQPGHHRIYSLHMRNPVDRYLQLHAMLPAKQHCDIISYAQVTASTVQSSVDTALVPGIAGRDR